VFGLYFAGATLVFAFVRYHSGVIKTKWTDAVVPTHWNRLRTAQGDYRIDQAFEFARRGETNQALMYARNGLAHSPHHRAGRLLVAQLLLSVGRSDDAQFTLIQGLPLHAEDPVFLRAFFSFMLQRQEDAILVTFAREQLSKRPPASESSRLIALAAAHACFFRGNYDSADDFLHLVPGLATTSEARLLAAKIEFERGYRALGILLLRFLASEYPHDLNIQGELLTCLRQEGLNLLARRSALSFEIAHPGSALARIELIRSYSEDRNLAAVTREVEAVLRDFCADDWAMVALANFATESGNPILSQQICAHVIAHRMPSVPFELSVAESLIVAGNYRAALNALETFSSQNIGDTARYEPLFESLRAVSYTGLGESDTARLHLGRLLQRPLLRADHLLRLAERLDVLDASEAAREVLARAVTADPLNQAALTHLIEHDLNLNRIDALPASLLRLTQMRRPSPDVLRVANHKLGSDRFLFCAEREAALGAVRIALARADSESRVSH
jgi:tetratricopeptide (TPR) repeat protein